METWNREKVNPKTGERTADGSVRFAAHAAGHPADGVMEMVHNMLTYGKTKGVIEVRPCGAGLCNYRFYNNANSTKLPSFEKLCEIASMAGQRISANKGVSLCGIGTEVMGLSARKHANSCINAEIRVVNKKYVYGAHLKFDGKEKKITYSITEPSPCEAENSYEVTFFGCKQLNKTDLAHLKRKIVDTMPSGCFDIKMIVGEETCILSPMDFLYRKKLNGTDNYEKHAFHLENGEPVVLELSDVAKLVRSGHGNEYEDPGKTSPELCGGSLRYEGIATICRGDIGWRFCGHKLHSTKHYIRFDLTVGKTIFKQIHQESQIKTTSFVKITDLVDEHNDELKIYDDKGNEYGISYLKDLIEKFVTKHKTDQNSAINIENTNISVMQALREGKITLSDVDSTLKLLGFVRGNKMQVRTVTKILDDVLALRPLYAEEKEPCYSCAR